MSKFSKLLCLGIRLLVMVLGLIGLSIVLVYQISIVLATYTPELMTKSRSELLVVEDLVLSSAEAGIRFCTPTYENNILTIHSDPLPTTYAGEEVFCNVRFPDSDVRFDELYIMEAILSIKDTTGGSVNQGLALNSGAFGIFCGLQSYYGEISSQLERIYNGFFTIGTIDDVANRPVNAPKPEFGVEYHMKLQIQGDEIICLVNDYEIGRTTMPLPLETPITRFLQSLRVKSGGTTQMHSVSFSDR